MQYKIHGYRLLMLFLIFITMSSFADSQTANAEPDIRISNLRNQLGTHRHIQFFSKNIQLDVVVLNAKYHAKLYQQKATNQSMALSIEKISRENNSTVAINGGFYTPNFQPAGLFIENGITIHKISRDRLLNACVQINEAGKILLEKNVQHCINTHSAIQIGPILIEQGNINPNIEKLESKLKNLKPYFEPHRRTLLAQSSDKKLLVIITSPITLSEAADILKNSPHLLGADKIITALSLDGGSSTGMYVELEKKHLYVAEIKPVKTFLLFE